jgi:hypothetical protein
MARRKFNDGMEVIFQDFDKMGALVERTMYDRVIYEIVQRAQNSFFSDSFLVSYASPTSVSVSAGVGFQTDNTQVDPEPIRRLMYRPSAQTVNLTAPDLVNPRIDIIVCKSLRAVSETGTRKFKDAGSGVISNETFDLQSDWEAELLAVAGTPAGSPTAPATPSGYIKIATLTVPAVVGMSGSGNVTDDRVLMPIGGSATINSLAFVRLTQSAGLTLQQALAEVDAYLKFGRQDYTD